MKTVLVTGSSGFIGKNLCAQLRLEKDLKVLEHNRTHSLEDLKKNINKADFVFHLAGVNRPKDEVEFNDNHELTQQIISLITECKRNIPLLFSSSMQAELNNPYGRSKQTAEDLIKKWAKKTKSAAYIYRLPNVFGKWCKPNYNSVVATFCHNIPRGLEIKINDPATVLKLVYIDDVVKEFILKMKSNKRTGLQADCTVPRDFKVSLGELAGKLTAFEEIRSTLLIPDFIDPFERFLYATYTSYLPKKDFSYKLEMKRDPRGWLSEFIKSKNAGQVFISRTKPGITRGNHWHHTKIEKFLVIEGLADIKFRNLDSDEILTYSVTGEELSVVDIPAGYIHSIQNTGVSDLITLFWTDEVFDPGNPDTYYLEV